VIKEDDVAGEIGKVIAVCSPGRVDDQVTVFDSTASRSRTPPPSPSRRARGAAGVGVEKKMIST